MARTHKDEHPKQRPWGVGCAGEVEQASWAAVQREYEAIQQVRQPELCGEETQRLWKSHEAKCGCLELPLQKRRCTEHTDRLPPLYLLPKAEPGSLQTCTWDEEESYLS